MIEAGTDCQAETEKRGSLFLVTIVFSKVFSDIIFINIKNFFSSKLTR